jgi:hypothetical protein
MLRDRQGGVARPHYRPRVAIQSRCNPPGRTFDPEGFVIDPRSGHLLVTDEYRPFLYEFSHHDIAGYEKPVHRLEEPVRSPLQICALLTLEPKTLCAGAARII